MYRPILRTIYFLNLFIFYKSMIDFSTLWLDWDGSRIFHLSCLSQPFLRENLKRELLFYVHSRILMIQSLISPYENRSWAHTNWILVRIWKVCAHSLSGQYDIYIDFPFLFLLAVIYFELISSLHLYWGSKRI